MLRCLRGKYRIAKFLNGGRRLRAPRRAELRWFQFAGVFDIAGASETTCHHRCADAAAMDDPSEVRQGCTATHGSAGLRDCFSVCAASG
jgi:hypothetical protein